MADDSDNELFDDTVVTEEAEVSKADPEAKEAAEEKGEEIEEAEPPAAKEEEEKPQQPEKMIPEHRLKAAIKDVTDKLNKAQQELAELKAQPVPDRKEDPDGYERHLRIETSKAIMRETHADYDEVMSHLQEMIDVNPFLEDAIAKHAMPAKYAYDIVKKNIEITELSQLKDSDEWKEFQAFKASKAAKEAELKAPTAAKLTSVKSRVPNLNRATSVGKGKVSSGEDDDDLFVGSKI